ncbi:YesK family protein [Paenibacillus antarcticus]|uniref:YesK family protein n=1 Tax=Paenibacillus antarcticus TaxID=253703 RepID=UPI0011F3A4E0
MIGLDLLFNKRIVYIISLKLMLVSIITILCSIFFIGGWNGIGFYCISIFSGSLIGILLVALTSLITKFLLRKKT